MIEVVKVVRGGASIEVATLTSPNGSKHTALGSTIDVERGHIVAYVWTDLKNTYFDLVTFKGSHISLLEKRGESFGFHGSRIVHFAMSYAGFRWHGKVGLDGSQLIHMRRGRKE